VQHSEAKANSTISIFSLNGKQVLSVYVQIGSSKTVIDVGALAPGKYIVTDGISNRNSALLIKD